MKLWGYYAFHTFINTFKKLFRSTLVVILISIFGFGIIFGTVGVIIGNVVSQQTAQESAGNDYTNEEEEDDDKPMTPEQIADIKTYAESAIALGFVAILLLGLYSGSKKGADIFLMPDVNFLFTAPMKPQSVLMFRLSFQMAASVFASIYLVFQIPNLRMLGLGWTAIGAVFIGWILLLVFQRLMAVLSYTVSATHEHLKKYVIPLIAAIAVVLLTVTAATFAVNGRDVLATLRTLYASPSSQWIPLVGWYKGMIMSAVNQDMPQFFVFLALLILSAAVLIFVIWRIKADFYEDAITSTSKKAEVLAAAQEGRTVSTKERSKRIRREGSFNGFGAAVFLTKEIYNRRRTAYFGFVTTTMLLYLGAAVLTIIFMTKSGSSLNFFIPGIILMAILFFRNFGNPIARETSLNWLFLVPESPYRKVFFAMLAGSCNCALDLLPALVAGMILTKESPLTMLLWLATLIAADFMLSAVGAFLEAVFPASALNIVKSMLQMFFRFFMVLVITIPVAVGFLFGGQLLALALTVTVCIVVSIPVFALYPAMLHAGV